MTWCNGGFPKSSALWDLKAFYRQQSVLWTDGKDSQLHDPQIKIWTFKNPYHILTRCVQHTDFAMPVVCICTYNNIQPILFYNVCTVLMLGIGLWSFLLLFVGRGKNLDSITRRLVCYCSVHCIWRERNSRNFLIH